MYSGKYSFSIEKSTRLYPASSSFSRKKKYFPPDPQRFRAEMPAPYTMPVLSRFKSLCYCAGICSGFSQILLKIKLSASQKPLNPPMSEKIPMFPRPVKDLKKNILLSFAVSVSALLRFTLPYSVLFFPKTPPYKPLERKTKLPPPVFLGGCF